MRARLGLGTATLLFVGVLALGLTESTVVGQNANPTGVITGVVASPQGPEAGVWVIAETSDLPTKFRKIVVTNDEGKFVLPELPTANYKVWGAGVRTGRLCAGDGRGWSGSRAGGGRGAIGRGGREGLSCQLLAVAAGAAR